MHTVNSDSKLHNTKSKQVTVERVTGIYMEKLHYHVPENVSVVCSVLVEILQFIKKQKHQSPKLNTETKCASYLYIDSPYKA